jgi:hypothetical protein
MELAVAIRLNNRQLGEKAANYVTCRCFHCASLMWLCIAYLIAINLIIKSRPHLFNEHSYLQIVTTMDNSNSWSYWEAEMCTDPSFNPTFADSHAPEAPQSEAMPIWDNDTLEEENSIEIFQYLPSQYPFELTGQASSFWEMNSEVTASM